jgi:HEPN domain-containing protein
VVDDDTPAEKLGWRGVYQARRDFHEAVDILRSAAAGSSSGAAWSARCLGPSTRRASLSSTCLRAAPSRRGRRVLAIAEEDAAAARLCVRSAEPLLSIAAYHCQQAAEKVLKAALIVRGVPFRRTHDLDELPTQLVAAWPAVGVLAEPLRPLTSWGFAYRYPTEGVDEAPPDRGGRGRARRVERIRDLIATERLARA